MPATIILLVEHLKAGSASLAPALTHAGYHVSVVHSGRGALSRVATEHPHLIVYDASLMRSTGVRTCRTLRRRLNDVPVIHCRAAEQEVDETAEDAHIYLRHPFTPRKLLNRVKALLPAMDDEERILRANGLVLYRDKGAVDVRGQGDQMLTPKMLRLLEEFMSHPGEVLTRRQLMQNVWKTNYVGDTRTLDVHVRWLRRLIEEDPTHPRRLLTVRGQGYIFHTAPLELLSDAMANHQI